MMKTMLRAEIQTCHALLLYEARWSSHHADAADAADALHRLS